MIILLYLGVTVIGYITGKRINSRDINVKGIGVTQTVIINVLLFVMGCRIGADEKIVASLKVIGFQAFIITVFILAGSVFTVFCLRKVLGFDGEGNFSGEANLTEKIQLRTDGTGTDKKNEEHCISADSEQKDKPSMNWFMTVCILVSVSIGIISGYLFIPQWFVEIIGLIIVVGLSMLLFSVGVDMGIEGTIAENFKNAGWRIIVLPFGTIVGTMIGAMVASVFLPITVQDALCIGSGFGWYTLAPAMLSAYSAQVSAISFMHNVMRELFGILLIPIVARRVGYIETTSLPGAAAMDVCLPIVEKSTRSDIAVYSFISGVVLSFAVPIMVSLIMSI